MNEKLRAHVEGLFQNAPKTRRVSELKEEIMSNLNEKYNDLTAQGIGGDEAFRVAVAGLGDVEELVRGLENDPFDTISAQKERSRSALLISLSVFLYFLAVISVPILEPIGEIPSVAAFLGIAGIATSLLVYHFLSRPKYVRRDDTMVENFKQWTSEKSERKKIRGSVVSMIWTITVILYFVISFTFMNWHISWVIFLIGVVVTQIFKLVYDYKN